VPAALWEGLASSECPGLPLCLEGRQPSTKRWIRHVSVAGSRALAPVNTNSPPTEDAQSAMSSSRAATKLVIMGTLRYSGCVESMHCAVMPPFNQECFCGGLQ
jgi:hypothetical protein